jgi:hypothetical protein
MYRPRYFFGEYPGLACTRNGIKVHTMNHKGMVSGHRREGPIPR